MKRVLSIGVVLLLSGMAAVGLNRALQAQTASQAAKAAAVAQLVERALTRADREVNVIVGLSLSEAFAPERGLSAAAIASQRNAIAVARDTLRADLAGRGAREYASWDTLPYVAMKVNVQTLQHLAGSPLAASIQEDRLSAPTLESSTALVGADVTAASGFRGDDWAVVILDTGIDTDHPFYSGRVVWQACFSAGAGGATLCPNGMNTQTGPGAAEVTNGMGAPIAACDDGVGNQLCDHGPHVAGIAAGEDPGTQGYNGVAPSASIIPIQVFTRFTSAMDCAPNPAPCVRTWDSDQISALNYVNTTLVPIWDIAAVNMSLGGGQSNVACDGDARKAPIDALLGNGVATVISAGNNDWTDTIGIPGCISTAVTVGNVRDDDTVTDNIGAIVDILAPGVNVDSSVPDDAFGPKSGTSMAAPHVTGAFAVIRSIVGPSWSVGEILTLLQNTGPLITDTRPANNPGGAGSGTLTGYVKPRLQLDAAVAELMPADLRVLKDCKPDGPFLAGQTATCTIFVDNLGPGPAINVELVDELVSNNSSSFTVGAITTDAGTCSASAVVGGAATITCDLENMAAGARVTIEVPITANSEQSVSDVATVSSDTTDPDHDNNVASDVLHFEAAADLSITKSHVPEPVVAGTNLTYTITVRNNGPSTAPNVVVKDILPIEVNLISATPNIGSCGGTAVPGDPAQPLTCDLGAMANAVVRTITVVVKVKPDTPAGTVIVNNASVASDAADPDNSDNIVTSAATVAADADLSITKTDSPDPVLAGAPLTYILAVSNAGPSEARDVRVTDTLPTQVSFVSAAIGGGSGSCSLIAPNQLQCTLGDLAAGANRSITIQTVVASSVANGSVLNNLASVSSSTTDTALGNNSTAASTTVNTQADLWLDKTAQLLTGNPSRTIRYTLSVYNKPGCEADDALSCGTGGPSDAVNVVVTDPIPLDPKKMKVVFVSQGCTYDQGNHTVTCVAAGPLPSGQIASFIIDVQAAGSVGTLVNTATVASGTTDPNATNNADVVQMIIKGGSSRPGQ